MPEYGGTLTPGELIPNNPVPNNRAVVVLTSGTNVQNTYGYAALINLNFLISTATTATISVGIGPTSAAATAAQVVSVPSYTLASVHNYGVALWVPANYFFGFTSGGTITVTSCTATIMPGA